MGSFSSTPRGISAELKNVMVFKQLYKLLELTTNSQRYDIEPRTGFSRVIRDRSLAHYIDISDMDFLWSLTQEHRCYVKSCINNKKCLIQFDYELCIEIEDLFKYLFPDPSKESWQKCWYEIRKEFPEKPVDKPTEK